jgi:hypothetical protein
MGKIFIIIILFISLFNFKVKATINCGQLTEKIEKEYKIPNKLLTSISLVESGIKKEGRFVSWPWTLNVSGKSKFFNNRNETLDYLRKNYKKKKKY